MLTNAFQDHVRATDGPVHASFPEETDDPLPTAWVDTLAALGYPASGDPFSGEFTGAYINAMSIDPETHTRSDAVTSYFEPAKTRPNLYAVTAALVQKILFQTTGDTPKATGIQVEHNGKTSVIQAGKEIVLAAGVFGTSKLLELSGIGDKALLEKLHIPVVVDNPNVGENLQDHPNAGVSFEVADGVQTMDGLSRQEPEAIGAAMKEYMTEKTGPFATGGNYTGSLIPVPDFVERPGAEGTLQTVLDATRSTTIPGDFSPLHQEFVLSVLGKRTDAIGNLFTYAACGSEYSQLDLLDFFSSTDLAPDFLPEGAGSDIVHKTGKDGNFFTICAALLLPLSRGHSHITSSDPSEAPMIDPRYLSHPLDLEIIARFIRYIDQIVHTEPLVKFLKPDGLRSLGAPKDLTDLEQVRKYVRQATLSCWHPTSTCAMLPRDKGGVVDP